MWEGIQDLAACLQGMADGRSKRSCYLSSLDPGVGKTQTVVHFLNALVTSQEHVDVGAVVFMFTKDEIKALAREVEVAGLPSSAFAARVHQDDEEVNALGCGDPARARILFTTHQRLITICSDRSFEEVRDFNYRGQPRQVRIWDERLLPARNIQLGDREIAGLYQHLPRDGERTEALVRDLDKFRAQLLREARDRTMLAVPDLAIDHAFPATQLQKYLRDKPSEVREPAMDLWHLFGSTAIVRQDGDVERRLVSFRENLPADLAPLVILDASGRVSTTYQWWEKQRGSLVRLKAGRKQYRNLTLYVWKIGGGASSFVRAESFALRRSGIVQTIKTKLSEPWLVVCHKKHEPKLRSAVMAELGWQAPVTFIHWGRHRATNEHRDIANVMLAGTQFLPPSVIEGIGRAASALSGDHLLTDAEERDLILGDQADIILQAVCRGTARRAVGGDCARCDVYLIAHPRHGIDMERLREVFPGCRIEYWSPVRRDPTGRVAQTIKYVVNWFETKPDGQLRFKEVYNALGMDRSNFRNLRKHDDFENALEVNGIGLMRRNKNAVGFCRQDEEELWVEGGKFEDFFPVEDDAES